MYAHNIKFIIHFTYVISVCCCKYNDADDDEVAKRFSRKIFF